MKKRLRLLLMMLVVMMICIIPGLAFADTVPANNSTLDIGTVPNGDRIVISSGRSVTLTGSNHSNNAYLQIQSGAAVNLYNATIDDLPSGYFAVTLSGSSSVMNINIIDGTVNSIGGGTGRSGIWCGSNQLKIHGGTENTGILNVSGGENGAGIEVSSSIGTGMVVIDGGVVNAQGGRYGAGIGGSSSTPNAGRVLITGGTVNVTGGSEAAGIGGGTGGSGGDIDISGGQVKAYGGVEGSGIGGGKAAPCGSIDISGGMVWAGAPGLYSDLGCGGGYNGTSGSISITNESNVFLENGTIYTIVPSTPQHIYEPGVLIAFGNKLNGVGEAYGFTSPDGWENGTYYGYFYKADFSATVNAPNSTVTVTSAGGYSVPYGNDFTFTISPNTGYVVYTVLLDGSSELVPNGSGTYTVENVTSDIEITVTCINGQTITQGGTYDINDHPSNEKIMISTTEPVTIIDSGNVERTGLEIEAAVAGVDLTLDTVRLDLSHADSLCALSFNGAGNKLTLLGTNSLASSSGNPGIQTAEGAELTIYGPGSVTAIGGDYAAGIGSGYLGQEGTVTIQGGTITATGGIGAAGIGGGSRAGGGNVTISGGNVTATGSGSGAGIGGGYLGQCGHTIIQSGTIIANGGDNAAGIGSGYFNPAEGSGYGTQDDIEIRGGTVYVSGGMNGAGIGGGNCGHYRNIFIRGGRVEATGGDSGAGIGSGYYYSNPFVPQCGGDIAVYGGTVFAEGGTNAEDIGCGENNAVGEFLISDKGTDAAVFLKNNVCTAPDTVSHELRSDESIVRGKAYGVAVPSGWENGETAFAYLPFTPEIIEEVLLEVDDDANATTPSGYPFVLDSVDVESVVHLRAQAHVDSGSTRNLSYIFYYKLFNSTNWVKIPTQNVDVNSAFFRPIKEGIYDFRVVASTPLDETQTKEAESLYNEIFFGKLPANDISIAVTGGETQFLFTETVPLEITAIGNGEDDMEYLVEFSTNGKSYKPLVRGEAWHAFVPTTGDTMAVDQTLPTIKKDTKYYIRVSVRSVGRTTTDMYDITTVNAYTIMPLASVRLDSVGVGGPYQVTPEDGIELAAQAANKAGYTETPTYQFSYRAEGNTKWVAINRKYSEENSVKFVPKTEGVYYFKVTAMSLGRKSKTGDVWDYDYTAYTLSSNALPVRSIYNLSSDKKDYKNGETIRLRMSVERNLNSQPVEYQLLYSTNGKRFKPFSKEYTELALSYSEAVIEVPELPTVKKDTIYYLKVQVRTMGRTGKYADAFAMTQVEMMTELPLEEGMVGISYVGDNQALQNIGDDGVTLTAIEEENVEYRFAYQMLGSTKWAYVSSKWSEASTIDFKPKKEGMYRFRVEARAYSRTTTDITTEATDYFGLYYGSLGAKSASVTADTDEFINDVEGIQVPVTYSAEGNGTNTYDLKALYSTNGKSYKELYYVEGMGPEAIMDASLIITLPAVKKDTHYWLKLEVKTNGHTTAEVFDTTEVDVYMVEPLEEMTSFVSDADGGVKVLPTTSDTLTLTALASGDATYKFYYRLEGERKWSAISSKYVVENQAYFRPKTEGTYELKAEATALGRKAKTADVSAELGTVDIYFTALPAYSVDMMVEDDDSDYIIGEDTEMNLQIFANGNEAGMEYQTVYSVNGGKSYKPLSAWQNLTETDTFVETISCNLPNAKKETRYFVKAQIRTTGRTTVDVESAPLEIWMLAEPRKATAYLSIYNEIFEYTSTIYARIAIDNPFFDDVEYQLQYSTDNKKWNTLSAHDWSTYNDEGAGYIELALNLAELSGDTKAYIKLNARVKNSDKIESFYVDSFTIYNIIPISSASLYLNQNGDVSVQLHVLADGGGSSHEFEYRYSYALAGQRRTTWIPFTSWGNNSGIIFTPSLSGIYIFKAEVRSAGRLGTDAEAFNMGNDDAGYYLRSLDDMALIGEIITEPQPSATPSASPSASATPTPSARVTPTPSVSADASASPSAAPSASPEAVISSFDFAVVTALGKEADISDYTAVDVISEDILSVISAEDAPIVIVQLGEDAYAIITGYEVDEEDALISLTLTDQIGEIILGGTDGILKAWHYQLANPGASASAEPSPSTEATTTLEPTASSVATPEPVIESTPTTAPTETPAA